MHIQGSPYPRAHTRFARQNFKSRVHKTSVRAPRALNALRALKSLIARWKRRGARNRMLRYIQHVKWIYSYRSINIYLIRILLFFFVRDFGAHLNVFMLRVNGPK